MRYRHMIVDCQRDEKPFGIVLARPESEHLNEKPYSVGTMVDIRNLDRLEDGRYTLMAVGTKRFRIVSERRDKPYLSGLVELYEDDAEPERAWLPAMQQARDLFGEYLGMLLEASDDKNVEAHLPDEAEVLVFHRLLPGHSGVAQAAISGTHIDASTSTGGGCHPAPRSPFYAPDPLQKSFRRSYPLELTSRDGAGPHPAQGARSGKRAA